MNTEIVTEPLMPNLLKRLENGELAMALGEVDGTAMGFFQRTLYVDGYACLLRQDHPVLQGGDWSMERFYGLRHAVAALGQDVERGCLAEVLAGIPAGQRCAVSPSTMGAAIAVLESDMVLTVPARVAGRMAKLLPLRMLDLPFPVAPYEVKLLWHERSHRNTQHGWIRSQIAAAAQSGVCVTADIPACQAAD